MANKLKNKKRNLDFGHPKRNKAMMKIMEDAGLIQMKDGNKVISYCDEKEWVCSHGNRIAWLYAHHTDKEAILVWDVTGMPQMENFVTIGKKDGSDMTCEEATLVFQQKVVHIDNHIKKVDC